MFALNNTAWMKAARSALEELFVGRLVSTTVYEFEQYDDQIDDPDGSRRVVRYMQTNPSLENAPEVYVFVGAKLSAWPEGSPGLWEPYLAWVYTPGYNYAVFRRINKLGIQVHWIFVGHQGTAWVEHVVQPPPFPQPLTFSEP